MHHHRISYPHGQNPEARVRSEAHLVKCRYCGALLLNLDERCHVCRSVQPVAWHSWAFAGLLRGVRILSFCALCAALLWGLLAWHDHQQQRKEENRSAGSAPTQ